MAVLDKSSALDDKLEMVCHELRCLSGGVHAVQEGMETFGRKADALKTKLDEVHEKLGLIEEKVSQNVAQQHVFLQVAATAADHGENVSSAGTDSVSREATNSWRSWSRPSQQ